MAIVKDDQVIWAKGYVTFTLKANGQLDEMKVDCPNPDFDFTELDFRRR